MALHLTHSVLDAITRDELAAEIDEALAEEGLAAVARDDVLVECHAVENRGDRPRGDACRCRLLTKATEPDVEAAGILAVHFARAGRGRGRQSAGAEGQGHRKDGERGKNAGSELGCAAHATPRSFRWNLRPLIADPMRQNHAGTFVQRTVCVCGRLWRFCRVPSGIGHGDWRRLRTPAKDRQG